MACNLQLAIIPVCVICSFCNSQKLMRGGRDAWETKNISDTNNPIKITVLYTEACYYLMNFTSSWTPCATPSNTEIDEKTSKALCHPNNFAICNLWLAICSLQLFQFVEFAVAVICNFCNLLKLMRGGGARWLGNQKNPRFK